MTRDDIIRMAKEAGFERLVAVESNFVNPQISELFNSDGTGSLTKFAQLVAAHEREECAKIVDGVEVRSQTIGRIIFCQQIKEQFL